MPLNQNPHQTLTRFGCVGFSMYACKCDNFACLHTQQDQNELHLKRLFFCQNRQLKLILKLIICPIKHEISVSIHEGTHYKVESYFRSCGRNKQHRHFIVFKDILSRMRLNRELKKSAQNDKNCFIVLISSFIIFLLCIGDL